MKSLFSRLALKAFSVATLMTLGMAMGGAQESWALPRLSPSLRYVLSSTESGRNLVAEFSVRHKAQSLEELYRLLGRSEVQSLPDVQEFAWRVELIEQQFRAARPGATSLEGIGLSSAERSLLDQLSLELLAFRRLGNSPKIEFLGDASAGSAASLHRSRQMFLQQAALRPVDPGHYSARYQEFSRKVLETELARGGNRGRGERLLRAYDSFHFVDYTDSLPGMLKAFGKGRTLESLKVFALYDEPSVSAFQNYLDARELMASRSGPLDLDLINALHQQCMKNGVEGLSGRYLGRVRDCGVCGNATVPEYSITAPGLSNLRANPYLDFEHQSTMADGRLLGEIWYPQVDRVKPELLARLTQWDPRLADEVRNYSVTGLSMLDWERLNQRFVEALIQERISTFNADRTALGQLDSPAKIDRYIELVAGFQRDFVSIHPFANGNGRTSRVLASGLLEREGLFAPRLLNPDQDILGSAAEWVAQFKAGMAATRRLQADATLRARHGLNPLHSPEVLAPHRPLKVLIDRKFEGRSEVISNAAEVSIDPKQYPIFLKLKMDASNPFVRARTPGDVLEKIQEVDQDFLDFIRKHTIEYIHQKSGLEEIRIQLVDLDYMQVFGRSFARSPEQWRWKMSTWHSDDLVWRGLVDVAAKPSEADVLRMFKEITGHTVSMKVAGSASSHEGYRLAALRDFERYNSDLLTGGLPEMARHHSEALERYSTSYGYSTSRREEVGKAFAMGAMVLGKYGDHQAAAHLAKSRLNVGMKRGKKDVYLGRLKQIYPEFSYKYGRQQEVMGIGAADPDSVMVIKDLNADGSVARSYVRNSENPNEVWIVTGNFNPDQGPPPVKRMIRIARLW